jgi:hypothetical protein
MARVVKELTNIEIDEISLVDRPANQHARVQIAKRATEEDIVPEIYDENGEVLDAELLEPGDTVFDEDGNAYEVVLEDAQEHADDNAEDLAPVGKSFADEVRESLSKAFTDIERDEVIAKAMEQVSVLEQRATQAETIAKSERDLRLLGEYVEVAKNYNVPIEPTTLAPVLMRMAETMSYDDCAVIHKALTSAGSLIFEEVGVMGMGDNADVMQRVDAFLEEGISKSDSKISKADAMADFFLQNPAAYDEYIADRNNFR